MVGSWFDIFGWDKANERNMIKCELWSAEGLFAEKVLALDRESLRDFADSMGVDDSVTMVWSDGEDPCLMIALSGGRAIVTLIRGKF